MSTIWLARALDDLERLRAYIEDDEAGNAQVVLARIFASVRTLDQFARRGRIGRLSDTRESVGWRDEADGRPRARPLVLLD